MPTREPETREYRISPGHVKKKLQENVETIPARRGRNKKTSKSLEMEGSRRFTVRFA
ncbi:MAG: hypothetical protein IH989_00485 [Planctomycetes bacterium]|nr:hypothetical protein [Planctomycetota bacterium]